jgi:hypothetical protein
VVVVVVLTVVVVVTAAVVLVVEEACALARVTSGVAQLAPRESSNSVVYPTRLEKRMALSPITSDGFIGE